MQVVIETIINGLVTGAILILVSSGFAFLLNVLGVFNVAHGGLYMAAAFLAYFLIGSLGLNRWLGIVLVIVIMGLAGILLERIYLRPFSDSFVSQLGFGIALNSILTTAIVLSTVGENYLLPKIVRGSARVGSISVTWDRIVILCAAVIILTLLMLFVKRTHWGWQMQALSQNRESAVLQGINVYRISAVASALALMLTGIAGVLNGSLYVLSPTMGGSVLVKILMIVIVAGLGSFGGIFIVGAIVGLIYAAFPIVMTGYASDAVAVVVVCIILLFRPQGFFGRAT